uniref:Uncharacterized protein n=1 Tax=viral metagenome TaxID=1070528 RepID=A0A6M3K8K5_9ZZZZ
MEFKPMLPYSIRVDCASNFGVIVQIGCGQLVFTTRESLLSYLCEYILDPKAVERQWQESVKRPRDGMPVSRSDIASSLPTEGKTKEVSRNAT